MITHLGIVIPAHNEQDEILGCLDSVAQACAQIPDGLGPFSTRILVVADACSDETVSRVADFAEQHPQVTILETSFKNVGSAGISPGITSSRWLKLIVMSTST